LLSPIPVILNLFQDPFSGLALHAPEQASRAVGFAPASVEGAARWILKQVQDDEEV
jgi:hypothetical protein